MLSKIITLLLAITGILYPVIVFTGIRYYSLDALVIILCIFFLLRFIFLIKSGSAVKMPLLVVCVIALLLAGSSYLLKAYALMLYYPVVVNLTLLIVFFISLKGKAIVTRFAELTQKDLDEHAVTYTRKVTYAWCFFFLFNGVAALFTVINGNLEMWTLYNGFISYILIGIFALCEYIIRTCVRRQHARQ
ncbi:MAG: hypothetical protein ACI4NE_01030 [Succinivibrio sp.]